MEDRLPPVGEYIHGMTEKAEELPPMIVGAAGLTGRPQRTRPEELEEPDGYDENGNPIWPEPRAVGRAIPPNCLRVLFSPLPQDRGGGCSFDCPGTQRDGSCLCDIVRAANAQDVDWSFEIDKEGYWVYDGSPLDLSPQGDPIVIPAQKVQSYLCPYCRRQNIHDPDNHHYWCSFCGKNASEWWAQSNTSFAPQPKKSKQRKRSK